MDIKINKLLLLLVIICPSFSACHSDHFILENRSKIIVEIIKALNDDDYPHFVQLVDTGYIINILGNDGLKNIFEKASSRLKNCNPDFRKITGTSLRIIGYRLYLNKAV